MRILQEAMSSEHSTKIMTKLSSSDDANFFPRKGVRSGIHIGKQQQTARCSNTQSSVQNHFDVWVLESGTNGNEDRSINAIRISDPSTPFTIIG